MKAKEILYKHSTLNKDGFTSGQVRWILDAMEEYAEYVKNNPHEYRCDMCKDSGGVIVGEGEYATCPCVNDERN